MPALIRQAAVTCGFSSYTLPSTTHSRFDNMHILISRFGRRQRVEDRVLAPSGSKPASLPKRRRALTLPLLPEHRPDLRRCLTQAQTASALLAIPAELRQIIWEEVVGGRVIHMHRHDNHLLGAVCTNPNTPLEYDHHWKCTKSRPKDTARAKKVTSSLALAMTCRLMYVPPLVFTE